KPYQQPQPPKKISQKTRKKHSDTPPPPRGYTVLNPNQRLTLLSISIKGIIRMNFRRSPRNTLTAPEPKRPTPYPPLPNVKTRTMVVVCGVMLLAAIATSCSDNNNDQPNQGTTTTTQQPAALKESYTTTTTQQPAALKESYTVQDFIDAMQNADLAGRNMFDALDATAAEQFDALLQDQALNYQDAMQDLGGEGTVQDFIEAVKDFRDGVRDVAAEKQFAAQLHNQAQDFDDAMQDLIDTLQDTDVQAQLVAQAQDSRILSTLRSIVAAARVVYSTMLPGGYSNYALTVPDDAGNISNATSHSVDALTNAEPYVVFQDKASFGELATRRTRANTPNTVTVWVQVNETTLDSGNNDIPITNHTNPNGSSGNTTDIPANTEIQAGDLIRMGVISASGNSFCVIMVNNSSNNRVSGFGWQSVSAELTRAGYGADCGAEADPTSIWHEMPDTPGTDLSLSTTVTSLSNDPAKAKAYSS
ncbi:MAG: hypothetical protein OXI96_05225, partial [Acidimicrobiaceae bacterium]|nr:hypothetical protein [Acidimicrobiaceae bacterium]